MPHLQSSNYLVSITVLCNVPLGQNKKLKSTFPVGHQIPLAPTIFLQELRCSRQLRPISLTHQCSDNIL